VIGPALTARSPRGIIRCPRDAPVIFRKWNIGLGWPGVERVRMARGGRVRNKGLLALDREVWSLQHSRVQLPPVGRRQAEGIGPEVSDLKDERLRMPVNQPSRDKGVCSICYEYKL
jgi:hypothetical protein